MADYVVNCTGCGRFVSTYGGHWLTVSDMAGYPEDLCYCDDCWLRRGRDQLLEAITSIKWNVLNGSNPDSDLLIRRGDWNRLVDVVASIERAQAR